MKIKVVVHLHGWLNRYAAGEGKREEVQLPPGAIVEDLMKHYGFVVGEIGFIVAGERLVSKTHQLEEGSNVHFYPVFAGG